MGDTPQRYEHPFTPEMEAQATRFYFAHYARHFSHGAIATAYAHIPQARRTRAPQSCRCRCCCCAGERARRRGLRPL
jgi:hypothetical protein